MSSQVLSIDSWNPKDVKFGIPKQTKLGKSINVLSTQTNRYLTLSLPRLSTWGISDFYDKDKDTHDNKFSISLAFPREGDDNDNEKTKAALDKLRTFQDEILNLACKNKKVWWDAEDDLDDVIIRKQFYKFIKHPKNKDTKKIDLTKPPTIQAKVECWNGKWAPQIFDTQKKLLFPISPDTDDKTPADYVSKLSNVSCVIECGGVWIGEKGWGVTFRLKQCVVKPNDTNISNSNVCYVDIDDDDVNQIENQKLNNNDDIDVDAETGTVYKSGVEVVTKEVVTKKQNDTVVEDSDDDQPPPKVIQKEVVPIVTEVVKPSVEEPAAVAEEPVKEKKKIIKKKPAAA